MYFLNQEAFFAFLLIPIYIFFYLKYFKSKRSLPFPPLSITNKIKTGFKAKLHYFLLPLRVLILIFLILALARPQIGYEKTEKKVKGIDIILDVDVSQSMQAEDFFPKTRIDVSKEVISNFISLQSSNRLGMLVFSGKAFTLCPLTLDYEILQTLLKELTTDTVKIDGTAIGDAIATSLYRFDYSIEKRSKVIILLTDGENNAGIVSPLKSARMASLKKVKIYTIGVGQTEGKAIPIIDPKTGKISNVLDWNGNIVLSKINEPELIKIAKETGGEYFKASDKQTLENIYEKIAKLEKTELTIAKYKRYSEKMYYFLIPAIILILLDFLLNRIILITVKV